MLNWIGINRSMKMKETSRDLDKKPNDNNNLDVAMYDALIRAARPWSSRYPLEDVQGSYGNPSSPDSHAAARYVEMKAGAIADFMFDGLKKNAITEWYDNYDSTEQIPSVFPSIGYWNIVNGSSGIAVAMATSVPQFNLREVNNALIKIIQNPEASYDDIYCAPDFATGGTITNAIEVKESLRVGKGASIRLRAKLDYFPDQHMIQATEIPYGVFTNTIIDQLAALTTENESYGIEKVVDHTKQTADIRIYLSKGVNPTKMIAKLYKDTSLENWYSINMILLDQGRFPRIFGWRDACDAYIAHIRACKRNIIQFDLDKALARKNIVDGLIKAYSIIDEVVSTIRASNSPTDASAALQSKFDFNEEQAKAILAMKLSSLTKLDIVKLNNELNELIKNIEWYNHLLKDATALDAELIKTLQEVADKFGDARRTKITNCNMSEEDDTRQVEEEDVGVLLFDNNTIRIVKKENLQGGKRGRAGVNIKPPKGANLINTLYSTNLGTVIALTDRGKMYNFTLSDLEAEQDYSIYDLITLKDNENIKLLIDATSFGSYKYLVTVSKNGYIKKSLIKEYNVRSTRGTLAVKLDEQDVLVGVYLCMNDDNKVFITSNNGYYNFYEIGLISCTGKVSRGVKAIKLTNDEYVQSATVIKSNLNYQGILTISATGKGKITPVKDFSTTSRAAKGQQVMSLKDEQLATVYAVPETQQKMFVSADNKAVLIDVASIPIQNRTTSGLKIINTKNPTTKIEIM